MPLVRRVIDLGDSKAVTIPSTWLKYYEKLLGRPIKEVAIEVNKALIITPLPSEKERANNARRSDNR